MSGGTYGFTKELVTARRGVLKINNKGLYNAYVRGATAKMRKDKSCPYSTIGQFGAIYANMWNDGWNATPAELKVNKVVPGFMPLTYKQAIRQAKSVAAQKKRDSKKGGR